MGENAVLSHLISKKHNYSNLYACTLKDKKNCLIEKVKCKCLVIIMRITFDFFYCIKNMLLSQNDASLYRFTWMSSSPEPHITAGPDTPPFLYLLHTLQII